MTARRFAESARQRQQRRQWSVPQLRAYQLQRFNELLSVVLPKSEFYQHKYGRGQLAIDSLEELQLLPTLTKDELVSDQPGKPAAIHHLPATDYVRFHQTSGTRGRPLPVLDTQQDWQWWLDCWQYVLDAADVTPHDRVAMAFSFGPFIGFWTANDALLARGAMVIPAGGMSSEARLRLILHSGATILCGTPTYVMHLAELAATEDLDLPGSRISRVIVAGEPGGSIAEVRAAIEHAWQARVIDHAGASELGAWGFGSRDGCGLHVCEPEFIAETLQPGTDTPAAEGELAELVLTGLGRMGGPAIRYRTGDLVRASRRPELGCNFLHLEGGVVGRNDDMLVIRGVNLFPSGIEAIVRAIAGMAEYRIRVTNEQTMDQAELEIEVEQRAAQDLEKEIKVRTGLRIPVHSVPHGFLPRSQAKAQRVLDLRQPPLKSDT